MVYEGSLSFNLFPPNNYFRTMHFIEVYGLSTNFMRYAYDFVLLDKENRKYTGDGASELDYYGFNKDVYAAGNGKVVYASNDHKDDKSFDVTKLKKIRLNYMGIV